MSYGNQQIPAGPMADHGRMIAGLDVFSQLQRTRQLEGRWHPAAETRRLSRLGCCWLGGASIERLLGVGFHRAV